MSQSESKEIFERVGASAEKASKADNKPLRPMVYAENGRSIVALVRTYDRVRGIEEALRLIGGIDIAVEKADGYVLVKPNFNSHDAFPGSTHPDALRTVLQMLLKTGLTKDKIVVGDMSGPRWLPTGRTMQLNGTLDVVREFGVRVSFFEEEPWVAVKPGKASSWSEGFRLAKTVYEASRIVSLMCLKTHQFGGVFTLSLKNAVGMINPADRKYLHGSSKMRDLIAEINLSYSADLVVLDGIKCFVSGGPAKGEEVSSGVVIAGGDRVAIDAVGASVLKYHNAADIAGFPVKGQEQLKRAAEIGLGQLDITNIELRTSNLIGDKDFKKLVDFIKDELK